MSKKLLRTIVYLSLGLLALTLSSCLLPQFFSNNDLSSSDNEITSAITNIEFPSESIEYPPDWPDDLKFSEDILLVEVDDTQAVEGNRQGWLGKFRFEGNTSEAESLLNNHFSETAWDIRKIGEFESGGFVLVIEKDQGDGLLVVDIDPEDPSQIIIAASYFP